MDMSKYRSLFLSDVSEHLDSLEDELLHLEGEGNAYERINEVFRHLHSIKGMAASMQYEAMTGLSHRLEDLVAPHRERRQPLTSGRVQLLLQGVDALRAQLEQVRQEQVPGAAPSELLLSIEGELAGDRLSEAKPVAGLGATATGLGNFSGWLVTATLDPDCQTPAARAYVLLRRLERLGRVLSCRPELAQLRQGQLPGGTLEVTLASERSPEEISALAEQLAEVTRLRVEPAATTPTVGTPPVVLPTVRVQTELLDFFVDSVSELTALYSQLEELTSDDENAGLRRGVRRLGSVVRRLRERVMEVRLMPAAVLSGRVARACHDLARQQGKQVLFHVEGEGVELDRSLIEVLDAPLLHLLRNALAHGIEAPEERRAAGKPPTGNVRLSFSRAGERVQLVLQDDGAGIDEERVKRKAAELGLPLPSGRDWLWEIISHPGFSTSEQADRVAGRGVGLDAVRKALERAGGRLRLETWPGKGCRFSIDLPLSVAVVAVLLVECGGFMVALPAERVARVMALPAAGSLPSRPDSLPGGLGQQLLPLAACLGGSRNGRVQACVVLQDGGQELFLGVEKVFAHREVVVRKPGWLLSRLGPYGGTAVLGDGQPVLVVDTESIWERGREEGYAHHASE